MQVVHCRAKSGDITNQVIKQKNVDKTYSFPRDFSWIENYKLYLCVFLVNASLRRRVLYTNFSEYCRIEKYGILKTNRIASLRNKRESKYKAEEISFEFCLCRFLLIKEQTISFQISKSFNLLRMKRGDEKPTHPQRSRWKLWCGCHPLIFYNFQSTYFLFAFNNQI